MFYGRGFPVATQVVVILGPCLLHIAIETRVLGPFLTAHAGGDGLDLTFIETK
jgi:hypothetical protein